MAGAEQSEAMAIEAVALALLRVATGRAAAGGEPPPRWAIDHAKVILADMRGRGWGLSPCEPDPEAFKKPVYSIAGAG